MTATTTPPAPPPVPPVAPVPVRARRPLEIPPPNVRPELPVREATKVVADARAGKVDEARAVIDDNGLTIEVGRLRERLTRSPVTDVQRLLLSTPGVVESLFLDAVDDRLPRPAPVPPSVDEFGEKIGTADTLAQSLADRLGDVLARVIYDSVGSVLTDPEVLRRLSTAMGDAILGGGPTVAATEEVAATKASETEGRGSGEASPAPEPDSEPRAARTRRRGGTTS